MIIIIRIPIPISTPYRVTEVATPRLPRAQNNLKFIPPTHGIIYDRHSQWKVEFTERERLSPVLPQSQDANILLLIWRGPKLIFSSFWRRNFFYCSSFILLPPPLLFPDVNNLIQFPCTTALLSFVITFISYTNGNHITSKKTIPSKSPFSPPPSSDRFVWNVFFCGFNGKLRLWLRFGKLHCLPFHLILPCLRNPPQLNILYLYLTFFHPALDACSTLAHNFISSNRTGRPKRDGA